MTEEEKAIDQLKILIGLEEFNKLSYKENQAIKILLTLIEKQQKEIQELTNNELDYTTIYINRQIRWREKNQRQNTRKNKRNKKVYKE